MKKRKEECRLKKKLFKKGRILFLSLGLVALLAGCVEENDENFEDNSLPSNSVSSKHEEEVQSATKEFTMYAESILKETNNNAFSSDAYYVFNGFISDDRLSFERQYAYSEKMGFKSVYHPAKVGYTFEFKGFSDMSFEILEVNPEENYVKLKMTRNGGRHGDED